MPKYKHDQPHIKKSSSECWWIDYSSSGDVAILKLERDCWSLMLLYTIQTGGQFNSRIGIDGQFWNCFFFLNGIGIDKFWIECYKNNLNPQIYCQREIAGRKEKDSRIFMRMSYVAPTYWRIWIKISTYHYHLKDLNQNIHISLSFGDIKVLINWKYRMIGITLIEYFGV